MRNQWKIVCAGRFIENNIKRRRPEYSLVVFLTLSRSILIILNVRRTPRVTTVFDHTRHRRRHCPKATTTSSSWIRVCVCIPPPTRSDMSETPSASLLSVFFFFFYFYVCFFFFFNNLFSPSCVSLFLFKSRGISFPFFNLSRLLPHTPHACIEYILERHRMPLCAGRGIRSTYLYCVQYVSGWLSYSVRDSC